jgi:hypothetical protein
MIAELLMCVALLQAGQLPALSQGRQPQAAQTPIALGSVSGKIVDEAGRPAPRVNVDLLLRPFSSGSNGGRQPVDRTQTDDRGEYRFYWVTPGWYYLSAFPEYANGKLSTYPERTHSYRSIFYPGTTDGDSAGGILVKADEETRLQNMVSKLETLRRIRGRLIDGVTGAPLAIDPQLTEIVLLARELSGTGFYAYGTTKPEGTFETSPVTPEPLWLRVQIFANPQDRSTHTAPKLSGLIPVEVGNSDVENLTVRVFPTTTISGQITLDGPETQSKVSLKNMTVTLSPVGRMSAFLTAIPSAQVRDDGSFSIEKVTAGEYWVSFGGSRLINRFSTGTYVSQARFNATNLLESPIVLTGDTSGEIRMTMSAQPARVDGKVVPGTKQLDAVLVPANMSQQELYSNTFVSPDGSFTMLTVIPGDYTLYVWEVTPSREYLDPNFIRRFGSGGISVHLAPSQRLQVEVPAISRMKP